MRAGQRLVAQDGYEIFLFPCEAMYITQGEHGVLALDFRALNIAGQRITAMPCYAPFSGKIVYTGNDHNCILESNDLVHMPDGSLKYGRVLVAHSFDQPTLGASYTQGDLFYRTGNYGISTAEHLHMEIASVNNKNIRKWNESGIGLYNAIHMWDGMYINNTVLYNDGGYDWLEYHGGVVPPTPTPSDEKKKRGFPWYIYLRRKRIERKIY